MKNQTLGSVEGSIADIDLIEKNNESKELEQKKIEFFEKLKIHNEKVRLCNEEKIRLDNLLIQLNVKLKTSKEKDKEDYFQSKLKKDEQDSKENTVQPEIQNDNEEFLQETKEETIPATEEIITSKEAAENQSEIAEIKQLQEANFINEPEQISVKEIIDENTSPQEIKQLQEEFPGQNIEEIIKDEVVEQINDKKIVPVKERKKDTKIKRVGRKITKSLLAIFVSANAFQATTFLKTEGDGEILSYNNTKVENLKDWENLKLHEDEINKLENISIITKAHENSNDKFIIIDKQNGKAHRYQGDSLIKSYNVCLGDSIGDEQTYLKSTYGKISKDLGNGYYEMDQENVPIEEATYVKNGERYVRDGYKAFTEWNEGNMQTGAGIYTISNKGPFLDDFGIFLKNERGMQVATSLHVNSHLKTNAPDFRFTNGCVGFSREDLLELYGISTPEEKVYILPDNPQNKYQIIDGKLRFLSNQQNVNKTIRPYESKSIIIKAENPNETAKVLLTTISENKKKLMSLYPTITNEIYNNISKLAYGIFGQESTFGTYGKLRGQYGRIKDFELSAFGFRPTVGPCQVKLENVNQKIKTAFNIRKNDDLFDTKTNVIAAMSILLDNYLYVSYNGKGDQYEELILLKYNAPKEAGRIVKGDKKIEQLGPKAKGYINKVLDYSKLTKVYTVNEGDYYNPDWNYNQPNKIAMNNINN